MPGTQRTRWLASDGIARDGIFQYRDLAVQHGNVDHAAQSGALPLIQGRIDCAQGEQAGRQVERITQRLRNDDDLRTLAESFIEMEQDDALNALEQTQRTSRNASPRLAAYLLLDAAL